MIGLYIPKELVSSIMGEKGPMNVLCVIPREEIEGPGIAFVRSLINEVGNEEKFEQFWVYFRTYYAEGEARFNPKLWNVFGLVERMEENGLEASPNRTNNPLERFNRRFADEIGKDHPSMDLFISTACRISCEYVFLLHRIQEGEASAPKHAPLRMEPIPAAYIIFKSTWNAAKKGGKKGKK